jgi:hypothetical protein
METRDFTLLCALSLPFLSLAYMLCSSASFTAKTASLQP